MEYKYYLFLMAIFGYFLNVSDKKDNKIVSYVVWFFSNTGWALYNYSISEREATAMFVVYNLFCVYGIYKLIKSNGRNNLL